MPDQTQSTRELEQPENRTANVREWWAERIGWFVIAAILIAALLGAFGPGLFSFRETTSDDGRLTVEYYAVQRYSAPAELRIRFDPPQDAEYVELAISQSFVDEVTPEAISPVPAAMSVKGEDVVCRFRTTDLGQLGHVVYRYEHDSFGSLPIKISLLPDSEVDLSIFVCP